MAVPKRKTSPSRRNMRRSHDALKGLNIMFDKETGEPKLGHQVCAGGSYNGRLVKQRAKKSAPESSVEPVAAQA